MTNARKGCGALADGKIIYEIGADDSSLDKDLDKAEKKSSSKLGKLGSAASTAGKAIGASFAAIGTAAVAAGGFAVKTASDYDKAINQFAASTGVAQSDLGKYEDTLKSIYANNYGESFEDVADAMATVRQQMGDLDEASLQDITESAFVLRDTFGYDVSESVRAATALTKQFGIDGDKAMNLIAAGAQNGLDFSGELLDSISEYSVQFAKVGLGAEDMFAIMQKGAETGAFNLDKVGDAIKEMSIRVVDGSATTAAGFEAIGLNADEMSAKFAAGGESAKEAFDETISALAGMEDPLAQSQAGVALFGTMWEDLGPEVVTQLASIETSAYETSNALSGMKDIKYDDLGSMMEGLGRSVETLIIPLGESLIPLLTEIIDALLPAIQEFLPPLVESISGMLEQLLPIIDEILPMLIEFLPQIIEPIMEIINNILPVFSELLTQLLPPLIDIVEAILPPLLSVLNAILEPIIDLINVLLPPFVELLNLIAPLLEALAPIIQLIGDLLGGVLGAAFAAIEPIINTVIDIFGGLIEFITGIFSGNWEKAWDGIVGLFKGIFNLIPAIIEGIINGAIGIINLLIKGINALTGLIGIPEIPLIPNVTLPRFHAGGIVDWTEGETPALLMGGEMVLTQAQQARLFDLANGRGDVGGTQTIVVDSPPVYLDGKLISRNSMQHQYNDIKVKRLK